MEPEHRIKRRDFDYAHVTQPINVMDAVMERFEVANCSTIGLVAHLIEWLVDGEKLV